MFEEGPIPAPFLKDTKFFNSLIFWAQLVLRESRTHYFTALEIVRNMLDFQLLEINEKLVLPMTQINLLTLANVFGNLNQDSRPYSFFRTQRVPYSRTHLILIFLILMLTSIVKTLLEKSLVLINE